MGSEEQLINIVIHGCRGFEACFRCSVGSHVVIFLVLFPTRPVKPHWLNQIDSPPMVNNQRLRFAQQCTSMAISLLFVSISCCLHFHRRQKQKSSVFSAWRNIVVLLMIHSVAKYTNPLSLSFQKSKVSFLTWKYWPRLYHCIAFIFKTLLNTIRASKCVTSRPWNLVQNCLKPQVIIAITHLLE